MSRITHTVRWPGGLLAAFFWSHGLLAADAVLVDERVLLIYGTGGVVTWEQNFNHTFFNEIGNDAGFYLDPEFLSLVDANASERELIARSLKLKYSDQEFAVIMATYDLDRLGRTHHSLVVTHLLAENLDLPVFGMIDTLTVNGNIDGSVVSTESYAFSAVELVRGALEGEFPDAPVTGSTLYMFNGEKLDQFSSSLVLPCAALSWRELKLPGSLSVS